MHADYAIETYKYNLEQAKKYDWESECLYRVIKLFAHETIFLDLIDKIGGEKERGISKTIRQIKNERSHRSITSKQTHALAIFLIDKYQTFEEIHKVVFKDWTYEKMMAGLYI